ncbi:MAG: uracil phosphoribosyltransferase [Acidobacteriota bacterium]
MDFSGDPLVDVIDHPLIRHKLALLRDRATDPAHFRILMRDVGRLLAADVARHLPQISASVETPLERLDIRVLDERRIVLVAILRAGIGLLDGLLDLLPEARVGHIGMLRDPESLHAREYYLNLPDELEHRDVVLIDPMLATGHTATAALTRIREHRPRSLCFVSLLAAPEGIAELRAEHPKVRILTTSIDRQLDAKGYIRPGLGDAGDRLFGTG